MTTRSFALVIVHQRRPSKERISAHQPTTAQGDLQTTLTQQPTDPVYLMCLALAVENLSKPTKLSLKSVFKGWKLPSFVLLKKLSQPLR
jgi:hypothetical protein